MPKSLFPAAATLLLMATAAPAQTVLNGNHSVDGNLCTGPDCSGTESFPGSADLKLKSFDTRLLFEDSSTASGAPSVDWELRANDAGSGFDYFAIRNADTGIQIFRLDDGAPANSLYVDDAGNVGLGTSIPQVPLQIETTTTEGIRLNRSNAGPGGQSWETVIFSNGDFGLSDSSNATTPFAMRPGAPNNGIFLELDTAQINAGSRDYNFEVRWDNGTSLWADGGTGNIGMGTNAPEELLHIRTDANNTDAFALFDAAGSGSDAAFLLRQQGTIPTTWEFRNQEGSGRLNVGIAGGNTPFKIDDAANNNLLRLGLNGQTDVVSVTGRLLVNDTQLSVPDYVFAKGYELRPLAEVQAFIDTNSHLPEVPSEAEIKANGVDMTQMQMTLLKKVEELTLYTLEQQQMIAALVARVETLEN